MKRYAARAVLVLLALAAAWGLWQIRTPRYGGARHVWPVHSSHLLLLLGMGVVWIAVGCSLLVLLWAIIVYLWKEAK